MQAELDNNTDAFEAEIAKLTELIAKKNEELHLKQMGNSYNVPGRDNSKPSEITFG